MLRNNEQKKILQELARMLAAKIFSHVLKDGTNINDEVERLEVQSLSSPRDNNYESDSNDDALINLPMLYMDIFETQKHLWDKIYKEVKISFN
jgi:hypothetical protein